MDGVISDFSREHKILEEEQGCAIHRPDLHVDYGKLQAMPGAKDALIKLNEDFDIFICGRRNVDGLNNTFHILKEN